MKEQIYKNIQEFYTFFEKNFKGEYSEEMADAFLDQWYMGASGELEFELSGQKTKSGNPATFTLEK